MLLVILLSIHILVCIALIGVILLQRSEGGALGMGGGGNSFLSTRGTGDLLTRTTQILAGIFFVLCLVMTLLAGHNKASSSIVDRLNVGSINLDAARAQAQREQQQQQAAPALPAPDAVGAAQPAAPQAAPQPAQRSAVRAPGAAPAVPTNLGDVSVGGAQPAQPALPRPSATDH